MVGDYCSAEFNSLLAALPLARGWRLQRSLARMALSPRTKALAPGDAVLARYMLQKVICSLWRHAIIPCFVWERSILMSVFVGLSVCLFFCEHISGITGPNFTKFSVYVAYGRGSILFWWRCDTLCTSGVWMTSFS